MRVTESQRAFEIQVECRLETVLNYQKTLEKVSWPFVHQGMRTLFSRIRLKATSPTEVLSLLTREQRCTLIDLGNRSESVPQPFLPCTHTDVHAIVGCAAKLKI